MMPFPVMLVGAQLAFAVADAVPRYNVEPSCRAAAEGSLGLAQDKAACIADENAARDQLVKEWSGFSTADRSTCTGLTSMGGQSTYTELLTCLEMTRDARKLAKEN
jgi:hypothetical protein